MAMENFNVLSTNVMARYCDKNLYTKLQNELRETGKRPSKMTAIIKELENESDFYEMTEYELSLLVGEDVGALRNNRRPGRTHRWPFKKEDTGNINNKSKVSYPLKWIRECLDSTNP